ncbi:UbiA family prenyltransferase [Aestuariicoccus sp. MJ-SS9]|uniref:UbiA family prenyltransferase n=1 Tax=Aestuariicoccus sp. MJ-SS9 TaxID=3079855 RepID=UPI002913071F|nr:UbiA family prenyltransferase [Aestuariicoccus sp. MJ-SS9]MDU8912341.1 UbiA family prenyltransferase [Aestuariicoccus sp. MJ-SS9]
MVSDDTAPVPLVLDVDGTLLRTDLLLESLWAALGQRPLAAVKAVWRWYGAPSRLKYELADIAAPAIDRLPLRSSVLDLAQEARAAGRDVRLVSGADQRLVDALAARIGLPGPHFGSTPGHNLTGAAKAAVLMRDFGAGGYDFAGDSAKDLAAWEGARRIVAVAPPAPLRRRLEATGKPLDLLEDGWRPGTLLRELRPHHWVKSLLLFLPLVAAGVFDPAAVLAVTLAAVAFSFAASALYILNDLFDLDADRRHPEKWKRPIASGDLPIHVAMTASAVLLALALVLALAAGPPVAGLVAVYMALVLVYSLRVKELRWMDVLLLAGLYTLRLVTGGVAAGVSIPPVLLALGFAVFAALACVKRITALSRIRMPGHLPRRGYSAADLRRLEYLAYIAVGLVPALFLFHLAGVGASVGRHGLLGLSVALITFWLLRFVWLSAKGAEDYDPVQFMLNDRTGLAIAFAGLVSFLIAV